MKIIISPAKKMKVNTDTLKIHNMPCFLEQAESIMHHLKSLSYEELKTIWNCNDTIAELNYNRLSTMNLREHLTPALLSYEGIQYQYMAPAVLEDGQWEYIQEHVFILSGFYGLVRPLDGVVPYRLEMQAKLQMQNTKTLYEYWNSMLYDKVAENTDVIINLASREYSRCIEKYVSRECKFITCIFGEYIGNKVVEKGTYAKMARGEMVRYMAEHHAGKPDDIKGFQRLGFAYDEKLSDNKRMVFIKGGR